jgi:hypothetical protein
MASRFWVGGTGTWDGADTTHWAATTGGAGGQSVPGSSDTVTIDASSGAGTITVNTTVTVQSITCGAMGMTLDFSANNNNVTLSAATGFSGTGTGTRTINLGNGTWTLTSTSNNQITWTIATTTNLTFNANSSVIDLTGTVAAGVGQTFAGGALTYSTLRISGSRPNAGLNITGANTFGTLSTTAPATISLAAANTIGTFSPGDYFRLVIPGGLTTTFTNAFDFNSIGSLTTPNSIVNLSGAATTASATVSLASGTLQGKYAAIQGVAFTGGATFTFTDSLDLGKNTGVTITPPTVGGGAGMVSC